MMLYGTIFAMPKTLAISAKDFGDLSESLWKTLRKTFANAAKDFRTSMFIPRCVNVCTIENYGLYHSPSSQEAHFGIETIRFTTQNDGTYTSKLP